MNTLKNKLRMKLLIFAVITSLIFWLLPVSLIMGDDESTETTETTIIEITEEVTTETTQGTTEETTTETTQEIAEDTTTEETTQGTTEETTTETTSNDTTESISESTTIVDTIPPVITLTGDSLVVIELGSRYLDFGATANDDIDGDITNSLTVMSTVETATVGVYTVSYNVMDKAGNAALEVVRNVNVVENIIIIPPENIEDTVAPSVSVDKEDYFPNDTVRVSGSGYMPGQTLVLRVILPNGTFEDDFILINDDGTISYSYNLINGEQATYTVQVIDTVAESILAECSFKDAGGVLEVGAGKAYATIQEAVNAALPGATINVYPGTYTSNFCGPTPAGTQTKPPFWTDPSDCYAPPLIVWKDGLIIQAVDPDPANTIIQATHNSWSNPVAIQAATGGTWDGSAMVGSGVNPDFGTAPNVVSIIANNTIIRGFTLSHTSIVWNTAGVMIGGLYAGDDGGYSVNGANFDTGIDANDNIVENCVFQDVWHAVYIWHSDNNIIQNNTVEKLGDTGHWAAIEVYDGYTDSQFKDFDGSQGNQILNNIIKDKGIGVGAWAPETIRDDNSFTRIIGNKTTSVGMFYTNSEDVCIKDNTNYSSGNPVIPWTSAANLNHYLTASTGLNGSITSKGLTKVSFMGSQTYKITPDTGYQISDVIVDGVSVGAVSEYTFTKVTCRHNILATFTKIPAFVTVVKTDAVTGVPIQGAVFEIYDNGILVERITTGVDGTVTVSGFDWAKQYTIKEISTPDGYAIDPNYYTTNFSADSRSFTLNLKNSPIIPTAAAITVAGLTEGGIQVLGFTGVSPIIPIGGGSAIVAGLAMLLSTLRRRIIKR